MAGNQTIEFDSYQVYFETSNTAKPLNRRVYVKCKKGDKTVASISFYDEDPVPAHKIDYGGIPRINFSYADFNAVYAIFLHEKPLFFSLDADLSDGMIFTGSPEPIGEEE